MENAYESFSKYIKREDALEKTPIGLLRKEYMKLNPDIVFNWVDSIKCIDGLDTDESKKWSKFVIKSALELSNGIYNPMLHSLEDLNGGGHIVLAEWYYEAAYNGCLYKHPASMTRFEKEFRTRVLTKLANSIGDFSMSVLEMEAVSAFFLLRNNYMKYKNMFAYDKLLALKVINRFAKAHDIRFEDAESVLRGYTYCI